MSLRKSLVGLLGATVLLGGATLSSQAHAGETVTIGTLAPKNSPWGKVFRAWSKAVKKKTGGNLTLQFYFNGQQGDEKAMIAKMRAAQLDGAAVTAVGLSAVYKPILALQMPGLFSDWAGLDKARDALMPEFRRGMEAEGFILAGSGDVGLARTQSRGKAIRTPADLKSMKVYRWSDDIIAPVTASTIGYNAVPSSVPGLLPALSSGRINVITVPALASTQLQWWSHLDHVNADVAGVGIGGLLLSKKRVDSLPPDAREKLLKTGRKAGKMLTKRIRKEDAKAYKMLSSRMKVVNISAAEKAQWASVFKKVRTRLSQGTFTPALVSRVEKLAGK
jgi:TRAP-type C4-dicarboxylate transport system substrate-binding protein